MTIIQPNKNDKKINFLISILSICLAVSAVWVVFLYNQLVDLRHNISSAEKNIQKIEVENAELRNSFYQLTDLKNLEALAGSQSLVVDKNPQYMKSQEIAIQY